MSESLDAPDDDAGFVDEGARIITAAIDRLTEAVYAAQLAELRRPTHQPEHYTGSYRATADDAPTPPIAKPGGWRRVEVRGYWPPNCDGVHLKPCEFTRDGS